MSARYANLLRLDGSFDLSVIARIAHATARAERNLEILVAAGIRAPRHIHPGETHAWEAEAASKIDTSALRLDPYSKHFARAWSDVQGFAKARRDNFKPAADIRRAA